MVRVVEGTLTKGKKIRLMAAEAEYDLLDLGIMAPEMEPRKELVAGEVGYLICGIKDIRDARVGDTVTDAKRQAEEALPGFQPAQQMVYSGIFPIESADYENLREALEKLSLNDAATLGSLRPQAPSVSASEWGSSGCSTWRSSRSDSSAITSTSSSRRPPWSTRWP